MTPLLFILIGLCFGFVAGYVVHSWVVKDRLRKLRDVRIVFNQFETRFLKSKKMLLDCSENELFGNLSDIFGYAGALHLDMGRALRGEKGKTG